MAAGETPYYTRPVYSQSTFERMEERRCNGRQSFGFIDTSYRRHEAAIDLNDIHYGPIQKEVAETLCSEVGEYLIRNGLTENDLKLTIKQQDGHSHYTIYKDKHPYILGYHIFFLDDTTQRQVLMSLIDLLHYIIKNVSAYLHTDNRDAILRQCSKGRRRVLCPTDVRQGNALRSKFPSSRKYFCGTYGSGNVVLLKKDDHLKVVAESNIRQYFVNHPNIVEMLGVTILNPVFLVFPEEAKYSLHEHIRNLKSSSHLRMLKICHNISCAMVYLHSNNYLHRSLQAKGCIINQHGVAKILDLGKSIYQFSEQDEPFVAVPTRWAAPEILICMPAMFTKSSDVWSFGVLFWEVFNKGKLPFKNIKDDRALLTELKPGTRLYMRKKHTEYDVILEKCLRHNNKHRPEFDYIERSIQSLIND